MAIASKYLVLFNADLKMEELEAAHSVYMYQLKIFFLRFSKDGSRTVPACIGNGLNHVFYLAQASMGASEF